MEVRSGYTDYFISLAVLISEQHSGDHIRVSYDALCRKTEATVVKILKAEMSNTFP